MTYQQRKAEKAIEQAATAKLFLAEKYGVTDGRIVWMGGGKFIVCLENGQEIHDCA